MLRFPHVIDYVIDENSEYLLGLPVRLCVVTVEEVMGIFEQTVRIRPIHHLGKKIWLGQEKRINSYMYEKINGDNGAISMLTNEAQYLVPRQIKSSGPKILLYEFSMKEKIRKKQNFVAKELVIENNTPMLIDYTIEGEQLKMSYQSILGTKASMYLNNKIEILFI